MENKSTSNKLDNSDKSNSKRTPIEEVGKFALLENLFKGSSYKNQETFIYSKSTKTYVANSKLMLEGVDFDLTYTPLKHLGYKSALFAIGNIYASSFNPKGLSYNLGLSARFCVEDIQEFWRGVLAAAELHKIENLSLELGASMTGFTISMSAIGEQDSKVVKNFPAVEKNSLLCITGNLGAAYMGLHVLEREKVAFNKIPAAEAANYKQPDLSKYRYVLSQYLSPDINPKTVDQFKEVKLYPSSGVFITKGLAAAVKQICAEYGTGAKIFLDKIPVAKQTFDMAEELNMDAITAALNGGDDYKFLFTVPLEVHEKFHQEFPNIDIIGHLCSEDVGQLLITPEGAGIELKSL